MHDDANFALSCLSFASLGAFRIVFTPSNVFEIVILNPNKFVGHHLTMVVISGPSNLKHTFKSKYCELVFSLSLQDLANLLVGFDLELL